MSEDPARVGRTIFVANAHRDANGRFIVRADERLTAFMELESAIRTVSQPWILAGDRSSLLTHIAVRGKGL